MDKINQATKSVKRSVEKLITKGPGIQQLCLGGVSGWCTGIVATKVGKCCALSIGTTVLLIGGAHSGGFININYDKFNPKTQQMIKKVESKLPVIQASICKSGKPNMFMTGFIGGFLIGLAC